MIKILNMSSSSAEEIFARGQENAAQEVEKAVAEILENVKKTGDSAVIEYTERFDGVRVENLRADEKEIEAAEHELARLIGLFRKCIEKLDPKSQEVVHCCYILGLTNRETAERLFYSITTVKKKRIQAINAANIEYMNIMGIDPNKPGIDGRRRSPIM